jgi:hypothetical protein
MEVREVPNGYRKSPDRGHTIHSVHVVKPRRVSELGRAVEGIGDILEGASLKEDAPPPAAIDVDSGLEPNVRRGRPRYVALATLAFVAMEPAARTVDSRQDSLARRKGPRRGRGGWLRWGKWWCQWWDTG